MDIVAPFVNIALPFSSYATTQRIIQRHNTTPADESSSPEFASTIEPDKSIESCIICGTDEREETLIKAPCNRHFVCATDVASYFKYATNDESLFPPRCCNQAFMLHDYGHHVPAEIASAYLAKVQGEYTILVKDRIYCANPPCAKFLHPAQHVQDPQNNITYAVCDADSCGKRTCVRCKTLLDKTLGHACGTSDEDAQFQRLVVEKGYQPCFVCGATIELAEACNHITCLCGASFCYNCGKPWRGLHGCPVYGPAIYDYLGYNQDGFHRPTGLNAQGRTRHQQRVLERRPFQVQQVQQQQQDRAQRQEEGNVPASSRRQVHSSSRFSSALPRIWLTACILLMPRTSLAVRIGFALCVSLVPPLSLWMPGAFGHEYDRYEEVWDDELYEL